MSRLTRDGTAEPVSRDQILRHARGQGNIIFPVQLTTSRIGNLTRLIHALLYVMTMHTYIDTYTPTFFSLFVAVQPAVLLPPPDKHEEHNSGSVGHQARPGGVRTLVRDNLTQDIRAAEEGISITTNVISTNPPPPAPSDFKTKPTFFSVSAGRLDPGRQNDVNGAEPRNHVAGLTTGQSSFCSLSHVL